MSRKKYSKEFKLARIKEHQEEGISFYKLEEKYDIERGSVRRWFKAYKAYGEDALERHISNHCRYTAEFKQKVVQEYLEGKGSYLDLAIKHGIHGQSTVLKWVKLYNSHEELTDSRPEGDFLMAKKIKTRTTTQKERIEIVEHCISNGNDYAGTAVKYNCSYGQVYSWVQKYNKKGVDGLKDGRGRNKPPEELSEIEKLRAENRMLKAEKKRQQMEIDLLKKLEEIERR